MPYIEEKRRNKIEEVVFDLLDIIGIQGSETGDVVYAIYLLLVHLYGYGGFDNRSEAIKVLECAKIEFYRKFISPYEDQKILDNGDIR